MLEQQLPKLMENQDVTARAADPRQRSRERMLTTVLRVAAEERHGKSP